MKKVSRHIQVVPRPAEGLQYTLRVFCLFSYMSPPFITYTEIQTVREGALFERVHPYLLFLSYMSPLLTYNTETTGIVYLHLEVSDKKKFRDIFRSFAPMRARTADLRLIRPML